LHSMLRNVEKGRLNIKEEENVLKNVE